MVIQRFVCKQCGYVKDMESSVGVSPTPPPTCPACGDGQWKRDYSGIALARPMMAHWNQTTGSEISDMKGFRDALKRRSEEATLKSGIEHNYEPIDYADFKPVIEQSDAKGLEDTNRVRYAKGEPTIPL